ncbi:MAG: citryl-CoA lyase [Algicola sp.]|nr:citryl-CoA lyase [Algicola sp.]
MTQEKQVYHSKIWYEEAEVDNPFAAKSHYCHGYNVTTDILPKAPWIDYLYLLFTGLRASSMQAQLLEKIAVAIANPGMRDLSIRAAMNGGVGGSTAAASLIAALGTGAGQLGGAREVYTLVESWHKYQTNFDLWITFLKDPNKNRTRTDVWPEYEHPPGFDPNGDQCPTTVLDTLSVLAAVEANGPVVWLQQQRPALEQVISLPLSLSAVISAAFYQLGFDAKQSEMLYLLLRLPGAAIHALEQETYGWKKFPFFGSHTELTDDPGNKGLPEIEGYSQ